MKGQKYRAVRACTFGKYYYDKGEEEDYIPGIENCRHFEPVGMPIAPEEVKFIGENSSDAGGDHDANTGDNGDDAGSDAGGDLSKMTIPQLKQLAAEKGIELPSNANKAVILGMLMQQ